MSAEPPRGERISVIFDQLVRLGALGRIEVFAQIAGHVLQHMGLLARRRPSGQSRQKQGVLLGGYLRAGQLLGAGHQAAELLVNRAVMCQHQQFLAGVKGNLIHYWNLIRCAGG